MGKNFLKSVMGGVMIAIGASAYLSCDNKYIGAFLFAFGLFSICALSFGLYTGKVGYVFIKKQGFYKEVLITRLANSAAVILCGVIMSKVNSDIALKAEAMCEIKAEIPFLSAAVKAFMCGVLMFVAVHVYNEKNDAAKYIGIFTAVPVFIISGYEHSVANMFYFSLANMFDMHIAAFILVCVLANAVGAWTVAAVWKIK